MGGNRVESIKLMKDLAPFVNLGILDAQNAKCIVEEYQKGSKEKLLCFVQSREIPVAYLSLTEKLKNYI